MFDPQKVIDTIKLNGPVIPSKIAKVLGTDIIMASAVLSELLSSKKIKISKLKVGGSPVYFLPGQENKLENFKNYLNEKDQRTVDLLKQKKVVRDRDVEPLIRVSLREIKDFAVPLQVNVNGQKEIFWKWHLLTNNEAEQVLKSILQPPKPEIKKEIPKEEPIVKEETPAPKPPAIKKEEPVVQQQETIQKEIPKPVERKPEPKQEVLIKPKPARKQENKEEFFRKVKSHFSRKNIKILKEISKKRSEEEYIIKIPSQIGELEYYCRAKSKKRISDSDLDAVFAQGQLLKLPIILVTCGELSKKAQEKLKEFKSIIIKKI
jgi:hypothetical protein